MRRKSFIVMMSLFIAGVLLFTASASAMDISALSGDIYTAEIDDMDDNGEISVDTGININIETENEDDFILAAPSIDLTVSGGNAIPRIDILLIGKSVNVQSVIIKTEEARYTFTKPIMDSTETTESVRLVIGARDVFELFNDLGHDTEDAVIRFAGKTDSLDGTITVNQENLTQFYNDFIAAGGLNQSLLFSQLSGEYPCEIKQLKESDDPIDINSKAVIMLVQQTLNDAGYNCGTPDGSAGPATAGAVAAYEKDFGMEATGTISEALITALGIKSEAQALTKKESEKANYGSYSYEQLARNPEMYEGELLNFWGKIVQAGGDGTDGYLRVSMNNDYNTVIYVSYNTGQLPYRLLEDDYVNIYGVSAGVISYKSVMGGTITIPAVIADIIEKY